MSLRIVWKMADGSIVVTTPCADLLPNESESAYLDRIALKLREDVPDFASAIRLDNIDHEALPERAFRNCWRATGRAVAIDLPLAKEQVIAELRAERNRLLAESDADKARLDDIGTDEDKAALATYRQALRDLPAEASKLIDSAASVAELKIIQPEFPAKVDGADVIEISPPIRVRP